MRRIQIREHDMPEETISLEHVQVFSRAVRLRLRLRMAELRRIARIQEVLHAAGDLAQALSAYSTRAFLEYNSHIDESDLETEGNRLFAAFARYAQLLQTAATGYRTRTVYDSPGALQVVRPTDPIPEEK